MKPVCSFLRDIFRGSALRLYVKSIYGAIFLHIRFFVFRRETYKLESCFVPMTVKIQIFNNKAENIELFTRQRSQ
jgi:hypothetical protein